MILHKKHKYWCVLERNHQDMFIKHFINYYKENKFDFNAIYQRGFVWTKEQKEKYILALFEEKAVIEPTVILYNNKDLIEDIFVVIDGEQRLSTILEFVSNKFTVKNLLFKDLEDSDKQYFLNLNIHFTTINTRNYNLPSLKTQIDLFLEINEKGTKQTDEHLDYVKKLIKD